LAGQYSSWWCGVAKLEARQLVVERGKLYEKEEE
jgi:hypothetical protein